MYYELGMAAPLMLADRIHRIWMCCIPWNGNGNLRHSAGSISGISTWEGVDIDEKYHAASRKYFLTLRRDAVPVTTMTAELSESTMDKKYDADHGGFLYRDITIPFQMSSVEFFTLVKDHLSEYGVMVVNMNMRRSGDKFHQWCFTPMFLNFGKVYRRGVSLFTGVGIYSCFVPSL